MNHPDMNANRLMRGVRRILPVIGLLAAQPLIAAEVSDAYVMSVIENAAQGERLTTGEYSDAIDRITAPSPIEKSDFAHQNNLCVAYTMVKKFDEAADACDKAIDARAGIRYPARWYNSLMTRDRVRDKAMAYSNRGVLRAVNGDPAGARDDFAKAVSLRARFDAPVINMARLENKMVQSMAARQNDR